MTAEEIAQWVLENYYNQGMILDPAKMPANNRTHILPADQVKKCCWGKTKCHCRSGCECKTQVKCTACRRCE